MISSVYKTVVLSQVLLIIIRKLERHKQAWPFMEKVDADEVCVSFYSRKYDEDSHRSGFKTVPCLN